jgi:hypothetical protein
MKASVRRPFSRSLKDTRNNRFRQICSKTYEKNSIYREETTSFSKKILAQKGRATIHIKLQTEIFQNLNTINRL